MWVKIKSKKADNAVLEVPYDAFLNVYSKKGYVLVENENAKNKPVEQTVEPQAIPEQKPEIEISEEEQKELEEIKAKNIAKQEEPKQEIQPKLTGDRGAKNEIPQRAPIKKPTVSKR